MHIWSQIARLGAFVAAFGPPVLTETENEPEKAALPTVGLTDQPVAEAVDVDAHRTRDELAIVNVPDDFAAIPAAVQPPAPTNAGGKRLGGGATTSTKRDPVNRRTARGWHGAGQRYG